MEERTKAMSNNGIKHYYAEPTAVKFHKDNSFVRGLMGPIGSGKSVACCMEIVRRAMEQKPNNDGIRKSRWAIIRNTYGELKSTTIKTWQSWISYEVCPIVFDSPIRGTMNVPLDDGTRINLELLFISLDNPRDIGKLLSLELTGAWINEAREIPKDIVDNVTSRLRRYPSFEEGGYSWSGLIMDTNPPGEEHWWYNWAEQETPQDYAFFHQPPAILRTNNGYVPNPKAENIRNHTEGYKYYLGQVAGKSEEWIKVMLMGQYGTVMDGKPVYPEYNDDVHSREEVDVIKNVPLVVGFDFGLTPACVFCQLSARGIFRVVDEIVTDNMGIKQFMRDLFVPVVKERYGDFLKSGNIIIVGDPAGSQRAQADDTITCFDTIESFGFRAEPAESNAFIRRRESVASYLTRMSDGEPCFKLSRSRCRDLRKGFLGGYHYARINVVGDTRHKDVPDKNMFSHVQDALQYAAMRTSSGYLKFNGQDNPNRKRHEFRTAGRL